MVAKCIGHMPITAELKAYWLSCYITIHAQERVRFLYEMQTK